MTANYQLIPFPVPEYLACYFAGKLNTQIKAIDHCKVIEVSRTSKMGTIIINSIEKDTRKVRHKTSADYYLKISNYISDHHYNVPDGEKCFLGIKSEMANSIIELIKIDFDNSLISFVEGAEFAHKKNGWEDSQKRKGIRKHAIEKFLLKNQVSFDKKKLETFFKMFQRYKKNSDNNNNKLFRHLTETMSF